MKDTGSPSFNVVAFYQGANRDPFKSVDNKN